MLLFSAFACIRLSVWLMMYNGPPCHTPSFHFNATGTTHGLSPASHLLRSSFLIRTHTLDKHTWIHSSLEPKWIQKKSWKALIIYWFWFTPLYFFCLHRLLRIKESRYKRLELKHHLNLVKHYRLVAGLAKENYYWIWTVRKYLIKMDNYTADL